MKKANQAKRIEDISRDDIDAIEQIVGDHFVVLLSDDNETPKAIALRNVSPLFLMKAIGRLADEVYESVGKEEPAERAMKYMVQRKKGILQMAKALLFKS